MLTRAAAVVTVLAALALGGPPSMAGASSDGAPVDRPLTGARVSESLRIAAEFFGRPLPCDARVYAATPEEMGNSLWRAMTEDRAGVEGEECPIWVSDAFSDPTYDNRIRVCSDLVHEIGHKLGLGHDDETRPGSIMNLDAPIVYECYRRFLPRGQGRVWRETYGVPRWALLP